MQNNKIKIALIGYQLAGGGLEKVMANMSILLDDNGIEVHNVVLVDKVGYAYSGKLINLGKSRRESNTIIDKFNRFWSLRNYIHKNEFDFVIDFRYRLNPLYELFINRMVYASKVIYTVHSSRLKTYFPDTVLTRFTFGNAYKIVCVSKKIEEMVREKYDFKKLTTIHNPINNTQIEKRIDESTEYHFDYIIGVGRLDGVSKQFDKLIIAYSKSDLPKKRIRLLLLGNGNNMAALQQLAQESNVGDSVVFTGLVDNPFKYIAKAKYLVMSSTYEGFPLVIGESLACGTPVVSFDCVSGPSEIITHKENGLLVENQNMDELIKSMNLFIEDEALYLHCKKNAKQSVERFSFKSIGRQWLDLMKINKNEH